MVFGRKPKPQKIIEYPSLEREMVPAEAADQARRDLIEAHLERHLGDDPMVLHERDPDLVHVDIFIWRPTPQRPMFTLATVGMSDRPMTLPPGVTVPLEAGSAFSELIMCLPGDWKFPGDGETFTPGDQGYYPIHWLRFLARFPHLHDTWLGFGHTCVTDNPPRPVSADNPVSAWLLLPAMTLPRTVDTLLLPDGEVVTFFGVMSLHLDELERKIAFGARSLFDGFDALGVSELLDLARPSSLR